ncbi:MAG: lysophospholipid acyltransferase family protein [Candidatus Izemoplasmataceae bacterium]
MTAKIFVSMIFAFTLTTLGLTLFVFDLSNTITIILSILSPLIGLLVTSILYVIFFYLAGILIKEDAHNMRYHDIVNGMLKLVFAFLHVKLIVTGKENIPKKGENFVFVCNHQENYDIMAIKPVLKDHPINFIAKQDVFKWILLGRWIKKLGNVPIKRDADREAVESIIKGIRLYKEGIPMAIFPEGKRTFGNEMTDFKAGAFKLAMKPKANILVGTIYDFSKVFKGWPFKRPKLYLHFHPLITYDMYKDMNSIELSNHVKTIIQNKLDEYKTVAN